MKKECTTHHHACDCREAKFAELEKGQVKLLDIIVTQEAHIAELEAELERLRALLEKGEQE